MCVLVTLKVRAVRGQIATMEDGRTVRLGPIGRVQVGDRVEVYADLALGKVSTPKAVTHKAVTRKRTV